MRKGEVINGYEIIRDYSTRDAGLSKWTYARKDGRDYFIKEFLSPKYPLPDSPGSEKAKERRRAECEEFEKHHRNLIELTRPVAAPGGNLIVTLDFFRHGAAYYKVTEKIDADPLQVDEVLKLTLEDRLVVFSAVAHSLKILHRQEIVHGDLKPTNIMIKKTRAAYTAKLIDFDNAYLAGSPPDPDELVGTINYFPPEAYRYIKETLGPKSLTVQADVFSLGLVFSQFLTGKMPEHDTEKYGKYVGPAIAEGASIRLIGARIPKELGQLVGAMLEADPDNRPTVGEIHKVVRGDALPDRYVRSGAHLEEPEEEAEDGRSSTRSRLKGTGAGRRSSDEADDAISPETEKPPTESRIKGTGLGKRTDS